MASTNLSAVAQAKPTTIDLASSEESWNDLQQLLSQSVSDICGGANEKAIRSFMLIVDLLTNESFDAEQRSIAASDVQNLAFAYSRESERAREHYLNTINPGRVMRPRKVKRHA